MDDDRTSHDNDLTALLLRSEQVVRDLCDTLARAGTAVGLTGSLGFVGGVVFPWAAVILMSVSGAAASMRLSEALIVIVALLSYLLVVSGRHARA